jgi:hypothetical protein
MEFDMTEVVDYLDQLGEILSDPNRWLQGVGARDASGEAVYPKSPNAVSWCLLGAIYHCTATQYEYAKVLDYLKRAQGDDIPLWEFNDSVDHRSIIDLVKKAKEIAIYECGKSAL